MICTAFKKIFYDGDANQYSGATSFKIFPIQTCMDFHPANAYQARLAAAEHLAHKRNYSASRRVRREEAATANRLRHIRPLPADRPKHFAPSPTLPLSRARGDALPEEGGRPEY